jgi:type I restriction enzyme R subunit
MNLYLDPHTGIDINILSEFIRSTQPEVWDYFSKYPEPLKELEAVVVNYKISMGTLEIITNGIPREHDRPEIKICYNKSSLNESQNEFWGKNLFIVYDEVKYQDTQNPNKRIDLVLAVNGIPIISTELKNELSGQGNEHGEEQFKATRSNLEPILRPVTGCLLYFSMSLREVSFTTSLKGVNTKFLPFNKGFNGGKGNPPVDDKPEYNGFRTHYMLDEVWTKDNLTDILLNYMFVDKNGSKLSELTTDELMNINVIAPRYNQISLVTNVINDLTKGDIANSPKKFLIQHSPGSGKTLSITWLAHRLVRLLSKQKSNFFDHVIVVTDRVVVVNQLDRSIRLLNKHAGMVGESIK